MKFSIRHSLGTYFIFHEPSLKAHDIFPSTTDFYYFLLLSLVFPPEKLIHLEAVVSAFADGLSAPLGNKVFLSVSLVAEFAHLGRWILGQSSTRRGVS